MIKKVGLGLLVLATAATMVPRKAEADCGGAAIMGGLVGLFVGSAIQAHANCDRQMDRAGYQRHLMQEVLQNYNARSHCCFVEYVTLDLEGWLTPHQQQQLLALMQQRRNCYLQDQFCAAR